MIDRPRQIRQTQRDNRTVLTDEFGHVGHGADRDYFEKARDLRFAAALTKQRVN